jgi:DNA polymerase/3'-5' exonuclease PolX
MSDKQKFAADLAKSVARELIARLKPCVEFNDAEQREFLVCAGSLRRRKAEVGDLELVMVPKWGKVMDGLFEKDGDVCADMINKLRDDGTLRERPSSKNTVTWGPKNYLAVHVGSGLPVDLFCIPRAAFQNYLVCRTGGKNNNIALCNSALKRGLTWMPYGGGFQVVDLELAERAFPDAGLYARAFIPAHTEREVFEIAGLKYLEPWERE